MLVTCQRLTDLRSRIKGWWPFVSRLLMTSGPSTVAWLVVTVLVWIAVNGLAFRTFTHIFQEVFKLHPPFAYFDATTTIVVIVLLIRFPTSPTHRKPTIVCK